MEQVTREEVIKWMKQAQRLMRAMGEISGWEIIAAEGDELIAALQAAEPAAWQFYEDGEWHSGDRKIAGYRRNTEAAGIPVRDLFALPCPPAKAQVPEGQAIGLLARAQGWWQNTDGDMPASLEQDIAALLTACPVPDHAAEADVCQNCETALPDGCGGIFAHNGTACRYGENQQEEAEPAAQHRYPCGCVTCICEDDVQCQGCGGTSCDDFKGSSCGCIHLKEEAER